MSSRQIVKQDYRLVNAKYKLSSNEIKIVMNAISEISMEDKDFHTYRIKLKDISQELHNESLARSYTRLKNFCDKLLTKPLFIPKEHGGFLVANWFSSLEYIPDNAEIEYEISPKLKPYLLEFKERFVKYNLKFILPLTSNYSIRLYQLFKEYEKLTKRTFTVEELQELLQVPKSYKIYNRFKEKVIQVAEREMIEHCDVFFEYEEIKQGRKVTELLFRIKPNKNVINPQGELFSPVPSEFDKYQGKEIMTKEGKKKIAYITPYSDFLRLTFEDGDYSDLPSENVLKSLLGTKKG